MDFLTISAPRLPDRFRLSVNQQRVQFGAYDFPEDHTPPDPPKGLKKYAKAAGNKALTLNTKRNGGILLRLGIIGSIATGLAFMVNKLTPPEHSAELQMALEDMRDFNQLRQQNYDTSPAVSEEAFMRQCSAFMSNIRGWIARDQELYDMNRVPLNNLSQPQQETLRSLCIQAAGVSDPAGLKVLYDQALVTIIGPNNQTGTDLLRLRQASHKFFESLAAKDNREFALFSALVVSLGIGVCGVGLLITGRKPEEAPPEIS